MPIIEEYTHAVASHCETGSLRNMLAHAGLAVTEPMVFGVGSGPAFYYLFFAKGPATFPLIGIRNTPGSIVKNLAGRCGIGLAYKAHKSTADALQAANDLIDSGTPVAAMVDMFYMKYLPSFLRVHAPFHFIVLIGRDGGTYHVSDPYSESLGTLDVEDLKAAWETNAPLAKNNFLCRVESVPAAIDWKTAVKKAMVGTCKSMLPPPVLNRMLFFAGVGGMRTYAKQVRQWADKYRGVVLREGMIFNAIGFEDQGTGGAAFRLMYGTFLQEAAELFASDALRDMAGRMLEHGKKWRSFSRGLVVLAKPIPMNDEEFDDWFQGNGKALTDGLFSSAERFSELADFEKDFWVELKKTAAALR